MKRNLLLLSLCLFSIGLLAQNPNKKTMDHEVFEVWNRIERPQLSNDGLWASYELNNEGRDPLLQLYHVPSQRKRQFARATKAQWSANNEWLVFTIKQPQDSLKAMRRRKVKKKNLPKDSLGIYHVSTGQLTTIANVQSFQLPQKWSGWLAYHLAEAPPAPKDSTANKNDKTKKAEKKKKAKKANKKNGTTLVIRNLKTAKEQQFEFVKNYQSAEEGPRFAFSSTGRDSSWEAGVYVFDCQNQKLHNIWQQKGKYPQLNFDKPGQQFTFIADLDTTKNQIRPFGLYYWKTGQKQARLINEHTAKLDMTDYWVSEHFRPYFSENGQQLFFGAAPHPILKDTTLLPEEIAQVEVWSYTDPQLHTQQEVLLDKDKKRSYLAVWQSSNNQTKLLGHQNLPEVRTGNEGNSPWFLAYNERPYLQNTSWEGFPTARDVYLINRQTGKEQLVGQKIRGSARFSPKAKYLLWYSSPDSVWMAYSIAQQRQIQLTNNRSTLFYNELNDAPRYPSSYGFLGWTDNDESVLIYDRYDIWKVNPQHPEKAQRLTQGREQQTRYRYIRLDREERYLPNKAALLLHQFDEKSKGSGYARLSLATGQVENLVQSDQLMYSNRPVKARKADRLLFTAQNFQQFPDLQYTDLNFKNPTIISQANPQQKDYSWGSVELYEWTNLNGDAMQGLLIKPENFDPNKKYPMIVNFYERSSHNLHRHRAPYPHRSTINYAFYANRGYLIFNPDVKYRIGYPGESAYDCVVSGVTSLIGKGFVDEQNIGVQGHSWGGYQIAHLITKTNIFKCAESGAPVVNMFSAYGGIRWGSGLSRMFQYEHTQSRIGGTIWEYPIRYLENSPLFFIDKIETPVLILHNDKDGAVPWYQGIEFFVAMRRLGKPAWLLNYNKEPHWPLKRQNRLDFNKRMAQFFDHYLKGTPKPQWMKRGVPAIEKGIRQGFEAKE